jgi:RIMS-binding protein 2
VYRRGLVPSNYITRLVGEDLMEFHQSVVVGAPSTEVAEEGWSTSIPQVTTEIFHLFSSARIC